MIWRRHVDSVPAEALADDPPLLIDEVLVRKLIVDLSLQVPDGLQAFAQLVQVLLALAVSRAAVWVATVVGEGRDRHGGERAAHSVPPRWMRRFRHQSRRDLPCPRLVRRGGAPCSDGGECARHLSLGIPTVRGTNGLLYETAGMSCGFIHLQGFSRLTPRWACRRPIY